MVTLKNMFKIYVLIHMNQPDVEDSWVPGASPCFTSLVFKMGVMLLVLQVC
jgi:hypothetical protein